MRCAPQRARVLLQGESLFNDATAVVLFKLFIQGPMVARISKRSILVPST